MKTAQVFIGIDPSVTHTGLVILSPRGDILCEKAIISKAVKGWRAQVERYQKIVSLIKIAVEQTIPLTGTATIFVEDYAPSRYAKSSIPTIELGSLLRAMLATLPDTVEFVSPATLKQFATGKGNADKVAVAVALSKRFNVDFGGDDNLYDAYCAARLALAVSGNCEGLTGMQVKIAEKFKNGVEIHAEL